MIDEQAAVKGFLLIVGAFVVARIVIFLWHSIV